MRKELMQEVARYGRLGRLRLDDLKGQSVTTRWRDPSCRAQCRHQAIGRANTWRRWCIRPNRAFPALVYHLHPRVRAYLCSLSAYVHPDACWATGVTASEYRYLTIIQSGTDWSRSYREKYLSDENFDNFCSLLNKLFTRIFHNSFVVCIAVSCKYHGL